MSKNLIKYVQEMRRIRVIAEMLEELCESLCEYCRNGTPLHDERVVPYGWWHVNGEVCKAAKWYQMGSAIDLLRHEHFNEYNPEKEEQLPGRCPYCFKEVSPAKSEESNDE